MVKYKKLISSLLIAITLTGCNVSQVTTNSQLPNLFSLSYRDTNILNLVDQKRLENNLAILTGHTNLPDGTKINERGTNEGRVKTRDFIFSYLKNLGYVPERQTYKTGENIIAILDASQPSNEYILIGAHFDSVKNAGADDNGSGVVSVMELATVLKNVKNRKVNIIFAFFDEEEKGLIGSKFMANEYKKQNLNITSVHTLDMIGWDSDKDNAVEIEQPDGFLWDYYNGVNKAYNLNLPLYRTNSGSTDHESFRYKGFTSVGICEEWVNKDTTPYYHTPKDTFNTVNFNYLTSTTKLLAAVITDLSLKKEYPIGKFIPHTSFPSKPRNFVY